MKLVCAEYSKIVGGEKRLCLEKGGLVSLSIWHVPVYSISCCFLASQNSSEIEIQYFMLRGEGVRSGRAGFCKIEIDIHGILLPFHVKIQIAVLRGSCFQIETLHSAILSNPLASLLNRIYARSSSSPPPILFLRLKHLSSFGIKSGSIDSGFPWQNFPSKEQLAQSRALIHGSLEEVETLLLDLPQRQETKKRTAKRIPGVYVHSIIEELSDVTTFSWRQSVQIRRFIKQKWRMIEMQSEFSTTSVRRAMPQYVFSCLLITIGFTLLFPHPLFFISFHYPSRSEKYSLDMVTVSCTRSIHVSKITARV